MGLSSNTLLHQTNYDGLKGIIKTQGFKVLYSMEDIKSLSPYPFKKAFPMISFSDIPFSELAAHLYKYGGFTIGMKREWIVKKGFSPVCYFSQNSPLLKDIIEQIEYYTQLPSLTDDNEKSFKLFMRQMAFIKNYEGYLKVKSKNKEYSNYRFSDEREWRYIPLPDELNNGLKHFYLSDQEYTNNKNEHLAAIDNPLLPFRLEDINYIIVDKEHQLSVFKNEIMKSFSKTNPSLQWSNLNINFFTAKQIENDIFGSSHDVEI